MHPVMLLRATGDGRRGGRGREGECQVRAARVHKGMQEVGWATGLLAGLPGREREGQALVGEDRVLEWCMGAVTADADRRSGGAVGSRECLQGEEREKKGCCRWQ